MRLLMALASLAAGTLLAASGAMAAPAVGGTTPAAIADGALIRVHGVHRTCERGPAGWHRTYRNGARVACRPNRPSGFYWTWRKRGSDYGWYHRRDRRWN